MLASISGALSVSGLCDTFEPPSSSFYQPPPASKHRPFPNLLQLLSVLPPQSAQFLPKPYADLMVDPMSPILPYFPSDFEVRTPTPLRMTDTIESQFVAYIFFLALFSLRRRLGICMLPVWNLRSWIGLDRWNVHDWNLEQERRIPLQGRSTSSESVLRSMLALSKTRTSCLRRPDSWSDGYINLYLQNVVSSVWILDHCVVMHHTAPLLSGHCPKYGHNLHDCDHHVHERISSCVFGNGAPSPRPPPPPFLPALTSARPLYAFSHA